MPNLGDKRITQILQGEQLLLNDNRETEFISLGDSYMSFVFQGSELLYPNLVKEDLILYYDFKGMSNTNVDKETIRDLSSVGNNGILHNFVYTDNGGYNNGLHFDGIDDYISLNTNVGSDFSVSLTLRTEPSSTGYILSGSSIYFYLRKHLNGLDFSILNAGSKQEIYRVPDFFSDFSNTVVTICYVFDTANKKVKFYCNGSLYMSFDMNDNMRDNTNINGIGLWNNSYFFKGSLYSVQIYNRVLNDNNVERNYNIEKERWGA